jgi:hypothetical protein
MVVARRRVKLPKRHVFIMPGEAGQRYARGPQSTPASELPPLHLLMSACRSPFHVPDTKQAHSALLTENTALSFA